jgi:hypothetical protein
MRRTGVVATVVTRAMITSMVKIVGVMTPRSMPMLSTISSIRPRVFIRVPMAAASRQRRPVSCAAMKLPPNLPSVASRISAPATAQSAGSPIRLMSVRRPL